MDLPTAQALHDTISMLGTGLNLGAQCSTAKRHRVGGDLESFAYAGDPRGFVAELAATAHEALLGLCAPSKFR